MSNEDLTRRVRELEERLATVEARLGLAERATTQAPSASRDASPAQVAPVSAPGSVAPASPLAPFAHDQIPFADVATPRKSPPPLPRRAAPQVVIPAPMPGEFPPLVPHPAMSHAPTLQAPTTHAPAMHSEPRPIGYAPTVTPPPALKDGSLEQTIGLKWAGWVGAVVLVIALGLGIKYAYDQGWFGVVPSGVKLFLLWLGSFALIGAGEYVYRRINRLSSVGLFGAGVAMLFVVSFAGHDYFGAYTRNTAFVLMAASTLVGALVAMRGKLVSIASLALIGGNLAPILLSSPTDDYRPFFFYLLMLQVTALFLAWWGGSTRWWALRGLSLATTSLWAFGGTIAAMERTAVDPRSWPLWFALLFAGLYHLEVILSAMSRRAGEKAGAVFLMIVTAALAAGVYAIHLESSDSVRGAWLAGIAVGCAALGFVCRSIRRSETDSAGLRAIAISYAAQAAILLVVAVPVAFTGWAVLGGWAGLALGFGLIGAALDLNVPRRASAITWGLCVAYLFWWLGENWDEQKSLRLFEINGTIVPQYLAAAGLLALSGHLIAWLIRRGERVDAPHIVPPGAVTQRGEFAAWQTVVQAAAGVVWAGAAVAALPPLGATVCIIAYAWFCALLDRAVPNLRLAFHAGAALMVATCKWTIVDLISARLSHHSIPTAQTLVFNPAMGVGALIAVSLIAIYYLRKSVWQQKPGDESSGTLFVGILVLMIMTVGLSMEVDRAVEQVAASGARLSFPAVQTKLLALTMLWSVAAAGLIGLVSWLRPTARAAGFYIAIAILLVAKLVVVDTLGFRFTEGVGTAKVGLNLQALAGVFVFALSALVYWVARDPRRGSATLGKIVTPVLVMLPWWIVTMEVDRWAATQATAAPWMARQVGWSIWWSIYAIVMVIAGFRIRAASLRYLGLAMFAVTLLKVVLIDLSAASTGLRILSFLGLGVLLLATSVLYGKLSPKLLGGGSESRG